MKTESFFGGLEYDEQFNETSLVLRACRNSTESDVICKTDEEIMAKAAKTKVEFYFLNVNFKGTGANPLQGYINTQLQDGLEPTRFKQHTILMQQN